VYGYMTPVHLVLLEHLEDGILLFNIEGDLLFYNAAAEWLRDSLMAAPSINASEIQALWWRSFEDVVQTQKTISFELEKETTDQHLYLDVRMKFVVDDGQGQPIILCTIYNKTELNRSNINQLRLAVERKRAEIMRYFSTAIAHDFRTPLSIIMTNSHILNKHLTKHGLKLDKYTDDIRVQVKRLDKLINQMLLFSEVNTQTALDSSTISLTNLLRQLNHVYNTMATERGIRFEIDIEDELSIMAQEYYLRTAIDNILQNAIQYSKAGQRVRIRTQRFDQVVKIIVQDEGDGIPPEQLENIFEIFYRVDNARTHRSDIVNNGLGLAITHSIIELHRGQITVESEIGHGTTVTVTLPLQPRSSLQDMTRIPENILSGLNVLVVDDDPDSLELARYILDYHNATVYTAQDGQQALQVTEKHGIQLVITDLSMPVMDGWELLRVLREKPATSTIPVIALTAFDTKDNAQLARESGFQSYIPKPLTADRFMSELLALLMKIPHLVQYLRL